MIFKSIDNLASHAKMYMKYLNTGQKQLCDGKTVEYKGKLILLKVSCQRIAELITRITETIRLK